jgi:hypothetical protein
VEKIRAELAAMNARLEAVLAGGAPSPEPAAAPAPKNTAPKTAKAPRPAFTMPDPARLATWDAPYLILILADVHVPEHDPGYWGCVLALLAAHAVQEIALLGDFCDLESVSLHGGNPRPPSLEDEVADVREALK